MAKNIRYKNGNFRRKMRARFKAQGAPCGICGGKLGAIDYDAPSDAKHPLSFVIDEIRPVSRWREFGYMTKEQAVLDKYEMPIAIFSGHYHAAKIMKRDKVIEARLLVMSLSFALSYF